MSNPNINIGVINESSVVGQTQVGKILITEQGNEYIVKSDGNKLQITDVYMVSELPTIGVKNKLYVLTSEYTLNYYDTNWHSLENNQIVIGTSNTDTTKLFLDINDKTKPILKWYDSTTTSWINISGSSNYDTKKVLQNPTQLIELIKTATKIMVVGDSISAGQGATGFNETATRQIYNDGTNISYEGDHTCRSWVNLFREYCMKINSGVDVINAGIGGSTTLFANENKTYRIPYNVDICVISLGINDYASNYTLGSFKQNYLEFVQYAKTKSSLVICTAPIPLNREFTSQFSVSDCERIISEIAYEEGCIFIPMYQKWLCYLDNNIIGITEYISNDNIHPNDKGYLLLWKMYQNFFNITDLITSYDLQGQTNYMKKTEYDINADGIVDVAKTLDKMMSTVVQIDSSVINSHIHTNESKLDKIGEDSNGILLYNNNSVGINIDNSNKSNGKVVTYNSTSGNNEWADINITGIIGSSQITTVGENIAIASGTEVIVNHPPSNNIGVFIEEQIIGSSITDTRVDFSNSSKYALQDVSQIIINNSAKFNIVTWSMTDKSTKIAVSNNNLTAKLNTINNYEVIRSSLGLTTGKWYWENTIIGEGTTKFLQIGMANSSASLTKALGLDINSIAYQCSGNILYNNVLVSSTPVVNVGDMLGIAVDLDANDGLGKISFYKNNVLIYTYNNFKTIGSKWYPALSLIDLADQITINAGATNFIYTPPTGYLPIGARTTIPTYLKTTVTSDYSLTTIDTIASLTIPVVIPTNTSIKCLFSIDNYTTYLYYDGTNIQKFTGTLISDWGSTSSSYTQLQTLFTNLSMATLTSMLSSLGIVPISLDFCFQLNSTDLTITPSISPITIVFVNKSHNEFASFGIYTDIYTEFGVKRINNSQLGIKNKALSSKNIKVNLVTSV